MRCSRASAHHADPETEAKCHREGPQTRSRLCLRVGSQRVVARGGSAHWSADADRQLRTYARTGHEIQSPTGHGIGCPGTRGELLGLGRPASLISDVPGASMSGAVRASSADLTT